VEKHHRAQKITWKKVFLDEGQGKGPAQWYALRKAKLGCRSLRYYGVTTAGNTLYGGKI